MKGRNTATCCRSTALALCGAAAIARAPLPARELPEPGPPPGPCGPDPGGPAERLGCVSYAGCGVR